MHIVTVVAKVNMILKAQEVHVHVQPKKSILIQNCNLHYTSTVRYV